MTINIGQRLRMARQLQQVEHATEEQKKLGTLRGGNAGIMSDTGDVVGTCQRISHLRSLGVQVEEINDSKLIMFQLGYANEDVLLADLNRTLQPGEHILREEQVPISWTTSNGTVVSGRPDIVICQYGKGEFDDPNSILIDQATATYSKPVLGLELKSVHSVWTARSLLFNGGEPKMNNVIQAAHYMWKLDIPYKLVYKSYSALGQGMSWAKQMAGMFPAQGSPGSEFMSYNDKGVPKEVSQFEVVFDLRIANGRVEYKNEQSEDWIPTLVTTEDITRYYEFVSTMASSKNLGPRPMALSIGGEKENYSPCGYCPLSGVCDATESSGYDVWKRAVVEFSSNLFRNKNK